MDPIGAGKEGLDASIAMTQARRTRLTGGRVSRVLQTKKPGATGLCMCESVWTGRRRNHQSRILTAVPELLTKGWLRQQ